MHKATISVAVTHNKPPFCTAFIAESRNIDGEPKGSISTIVNLNHEKNRHRCKPLWIIIHKLYAVALIHANLLVAVAWDLT